MILIQVVDESCFETLVWGVRHSLITLCLGTTSTEPYILAVGEQQ